MNIDLSKIEGLKSNSDGTFIGRCPACASENSDKNNKNHLKIYKNGAFSCVVDQSKEHYKKIYEFLFNPLLKTTNQISQEPSIEASTQRIFDASVLSRLLPNYDFYTSKGISVETLKTFKCGVSLGGILMNRIVFPIFNDKGQIHGFSGRWVSSKPNDIKWKHVGRVSIRSYPLNLSKPYILEKKEVILVESIGNLLRLWDNGIKNVLVMFGKELSKTLLAKLISLNSKIIIATDRDKNKAGQEAALKIQDKLLNYFDKSQIEIRLPLEGYKDLFDITDTNLIKVWYNGH